MKVKKNSRGISIIELLIIIIVVGIIGALGWLIYNKATPETTPAKTSSITPVSKTTNKLIAVDKSVSFEYPSKWTETNNLHNDPGYFYQDVTLTSPNKDQSVTFQLFNYKDMENALPKGPINCPNMTYDPNPYGIPGQNLSINTTYDLAAIAQDYWFLKNKNPSLGLSGFCDGTINNKLPDGNAFVLSANTYIKEPNELFNNPAFDSTNNTYNFTLLENDPEFETTLTIFRSVV